MKDGFLLHYIYLYIINTYQLYTNNKCIIDNQDNVTKYKNKAQFYLKPIKFFRIFNKCSFFINQYYWKVKSADASLYYTTTDDEQKTLKEILKKTKISEFRNRLVNDYFEYCLISYLTEEDISLMEPLSSGKEVKIKSNITMITQDYYTANSTSIVGDKSPDCTLIEGTKKILIDAYDGANEDHIKKKIRKYKNTFSNADVYVFASNVARLEQLSSKNLPTFQFKRLNNDNHLETVDKIEIGTLTIDANEIHEKYFQEYERFQSEVFYWQRCENQKTIIQTDINNKEL